MKMTFHESEEAKIIIYREYFMRLLAYPKPLRDHLIIELPTLNALRTAEVATVKIEHIDLERGDLQVYDSKKKRLITVPLDYTVAKHIAIYVGKTGIKEGFLLKRGRGRRRVGRMTNEAIQYIWNRWCDACGIPRMSPRYGRAYFAVEWHIVRRKSLIGLMDVLRHSSLLATQKYLSKIRCYEDVKSEFYEGMRPRFLSKCERSDLCPLATDGCHCKMFVAKAEVAPLTTRMQPLKPS